MKNLLVIKHGKNIKYFLVIFSLIISITFISLFISNKDALLRRIGYETFGGCCYNLTIAKWAYGSMVSNHDSDRQETINNTGKDPQWANHQLARIYFVEGDYNTALIYINREIALYPDNLNAYYIKGLIYGFMNNNHDAIETFKYYTSRTHTWAGHNDLAWLQFKIGDYAGALATIDKIKDTYTDNVWVLNTRAIILYNLYRIDEAKNDIDKAQIAIDKMTSERWGSSYPGNDPSIYAEGLIKMKQSIEENHKLIYNDQK